MILKEISIDSLLANYKEEENIFVDIPFLYTPVLLELKKIEGLILKIRISINIRKVSKIGSILSFLRICGIPDEINDNIEFVVLNYPNKQIFVEFTNSGLLFAGICELKDKTLEFSEESSSIRIVKKNHDQSIIVLPEGDGRYYMTLDKKESEEGDRKSIIGDPKILRESLLWLNGRISV